MILSDFYSEGAHKIDSWTVNNESLSTDTKGMAVAMLSERLDSLGTPSYISRWWHRLAGTN